MINNRRSFIVGLKSYKLSSQEIKFLKKYKPWGIILFSRNIKTIKQTKLLTNEIKKIFLDKNYPIIVDQEGGRVNRFANIISNSFFSAEYFGKLYTKNFKYFNYQYKLFISQTSYLMKKMGININTLPVLDVRTKNSSQIIGDRSFSVNPSIVSKIGNFCIKNFHKNKIATVIKHIPGHGRAKLDSHKYTPVVKTHIKKLNKIDFFPFKKKNSIFAMTAHIIFDKIDPINTTTHSKKVINNIRKKIKFKNLLLSDDISMKSLKFSIKENTIKSFKAGCNLVLHCNGNINEMINVAKNSPKVNSFIIKKTSQFYKIIS
tara:strand:+ start:2184 stop:3134 length:951 start_codon:yes stop_codon:yes gene_type:complete